MNYKIQTLPKQGGNSRSFQEKSDPSTEVSYSQSNYLNPNPFSSRFVQKSYPQGKTPFSSKIQTPSEPVYKARPTQERPCPRIEASYSLSNHSIYNPSSYNFADKNNQFDPQVKTPFPSKIQTPSEPVYKARPTQERPGPRKETYSSRTHQDDDNSFNDGSFENKTRFRTQNTIPVELRTHTLPEQAERRRRNYQEMSNSNEVISYSAFEKSSLDRPQPKVFAHEVTQPRQSQTSRIPKAEVPISKDDGLWKDPDFRHDNLSIFGESPDEESWNELKGFWDAKWKSIYWTHQLVVDKIEAKDVIQVFLGDCYFDAVVSGFAEKIKRLEDHIRERQDRLGGFEMVCYDMGKRGVLQLDSYFPSIMNKERKLVTISGTNGNESWFLFFEKGFAKTFKSYAAIGGGDPRQAMRFLTGAPTEMFETANFRSTYKLERLWSKLTENHRHLWACGIENKPEGYPLMGLVGNHVYTILRAFHTKSGKMLLVIRNPWGKRNNDGLGEWEGDYSDENLKKWRAMAKDIPFAYEGANDGLFLMDLQDFVQYFDYAAVCYLRSGFDLSSKEASSKTGEVKNFEITVKGRDTSFFIMVNQESERKFPKPQRLKENFQPSLITFDVFDSKGRRKAEISGYDEQVSKEVTLSPGKYKVAIKVNWSTFAKSNKINYFVLNTYGPGNVRLGNQVL